MISVNNTVDVWSVDNMSLAVNAVHNSSQSALTNLSEDAPWKIRMREVRNHGSAVTSKRFSDDKQYRYVTHVCSHCPHAVTRSFMNALISV